MRLKDIKIKFLVKVTLVSFFLGVLLFNLATRNRSSANPSQLTLEQLEANAFAGSTESCESSCAFEAQASYQQDMNDLNQALTGCLTEVENTLWLSWLSTVSPWAPVSNLVTAWDLVVETLPEAYACIASADADFGYAMDMSTEVWDGCEGGCPDL